MSKSKFSESVDGLGIYPSATSSPGDLVHIGPSDSLTYEEVYLWAQNTYAGELLLTLEWGDDNDPDNLIQMTIAPQAGPQLVIPGLILKGNSTPLEIRAFSESSGLGTSIVLYGYVIPYKID